MPELPAYQRRVHKLSKMVLEPRAVNFLYEQAHIRDKQQKNVHCSGSTWCNGIVVHGVMASL
jgi:hypothetical protein